MPEITADAVDLTRRYLPEFASDRTLSVATIVCSNPVVLVFSESCEHPVCVLKYGDPFKLESQRKTLLAFQDLLGTRVARPVAVVQFSDGSAVSIETGLAGYPWFQLARHFSTLQKWDLVRSRAIGALKAFHAAVGARSVWRTTVHAGNSLRASLDACLSAGISIRTKAIEFIHELAACLDEHGTVESSFQHGDFCLNNLMITDVSANIIDFEDFGETAMPLHDCFGLALSLHDHSRGICPCRTLKADIEECVHASPSGAQWGARSLLGLLVHYLLWLAHRCGGNRRKARQHSLLSLLHDIVDNPRKCIDASTAHYSSGLNTGP